MNKQHNSVCFFVVCQKDDRSQIRVSLWAFLLCKHCAAKDREQKQNVFLFTFAKVHQADKFDSGSFDEFFSSCSTIMFLQSIFAQFYIRFEELRQSKSNGGRVDHQSHMRNWNMPFGISDKLWNYCCYYNKISKWNDLIISWSTKATLIFFCLPRDFCRWQFAQLRYIPRV